MTTTEHKYFTVEGDPVIVGELYERRDGVVVPCEAMGQRGDRNCLMAGGLRYRSAGFFNGRKTPSKYDLMRPHTKTELQALMTPLEYIVDLFEGCCSSMNGDHEAITEARAAIAAVREFEGKSDGK